MSSDYERIKAAIRFIERNFRSQPSLDEVAAEIGLSPFHFQRLFRQWAGVSPKRFLQFMTVEYAKALLAESRSVLDATYEVGLSGPGRLHDLFVTIEAMTPGEYKQKGAGLQIRYGVHPSPFGPAFLAVTDRGICGLSFLSHELVDEAIAELRSASTEAEVSEDVRDTKSVAERIFAPVRNGEQRITLFVQGTNFQINVWKAILRIPSGYVCSYDQIARAIGCPKASRAVGNALAANPIGFLIPCHRVIRRLGLPGNYRWGETRKRALLAWEAAHRHGEEGSRAEMIISQATPSQNQFLF